MGRLFAGTQWDRPPHCERCGAPESECSCPPPGPAPPERVDPSTQTARIRVEKRPKGKMVTTVRGLDARGNDLPALAARLKAAIGGGGTVKDDGTIEVQGDHPDRVEAILGSIGYKTKRG
ncbi:translation initiation factor [Tautonia plasticadhaerens]|uniref:Translation initiation factor Sui1 n=1 Tax=Tautonia plasticadhaerens TaxID=2527974 RepID=A0A518H146_9BACT|nr:translation initiation factor [Tautonia plasticadhaerens]QDV34551.1 translation initiation factor Sui1 [Tautonia plasticadhaerens]